MSSDGSGEWDQAETSLVSHATTRRRVLQTGSVGLATSAGCIAGEFPAGAGSGPDRDFDGPDIQNPSNTKKDIQQWASIEAADGEFGRRSR